MSKLYYVYILANDRPTLYIGVTSDLIGRVYQHQNGLAEGFSKRYKTYKLVYFESTESVEAAIKREKDLKHWKRDWKLRLIQESNPDMEDLYSTIAGFSPAQE